MTDVVLIIMSMPLGRSSRHCALQASSDRCVSNWVRVAWPNGADLAPDAMYDAIRASGRWVVAA